MPTWDVTTEIVASSFTLDGDKNITPGDGSMFHLDTSTLTDASTSASGTATKFTSMTIEAPTLAAENASVTTSDAATLYISGAPAIGCNQTVTRAHSLWVDSGNVRFDGGLYMGTTQLVTNALAIDNGTANITSGGILKIDVDSGATIDACGGGINAAGSITLGAGNDAGFYVSGDDLYIENKTSDNDLIFRVNDGGTFTEVARVVGSVSAMRFAEISTPAQPAGGAGGYLYAKADGKPYWRSNEIAETALDGGGGTTINNDVANRLVTVAACTAELCGEANLTFATGVLGHTLAGSAEYNITAHVAGQFSPPAISLRKSRNATVGCHTTMVDQDQLGTIYWRGSDGTDFQEGAQIMGVATQTWSHGSANSGAELRFATVPNCSNSMTNRMTLEQGGDVTVETGNLVIGTAGKGIDFSASADETGAGSASAELLCDYEEGTWTPILFDNCVGSCESDQASVGYVHQAGYYTKIGRLIHFHARFITNSLGDLTTSHTARIGGLPFVPNLPQDAPYYWGYASGLCLGSASALTGRIQGDDDYIYVHKWSATTGHTCVTIAEWSANGGGYFAGSYFI